MGGTRCRLGCRCDTDTDDLHRVRLDRAVLWLWYCTVLFLMCVV